MKKAAPFRRYVSTISTPPKGAHGRPVTTIKASTKEEEVKVTARRIAKAERDERREITLQLTPVRTYMAGFTRPTELRTSSWFPGGAFNARKKAYLSPSEAAYEPHTVFILESRFPVKHGIGRVDSVDHIIGVCRAGDLPDILRDYNSPRAPPEPAKSMDNARWPWQDPMSIKKARWWTSKAEWVEAMKETTDVSQEEIEELYSKAKITQTDVSSEIIEDGETEELDAWRKERRDARRKKAQAQAQASPPEPPHTADIPRPPSAKSEGSLLHTSQGDPGHYMNDKRHLDKQREALNKSLSEHRTNSNATPLDMIRPTNKIPFEVESKDGIFSHPSGFVPPTPAHHFSDEGGAPAPAPTQPAIQPASRAESYSEADVDHLRWKEIREADQHLMSGAAGVEASTASREQKIPTEVTGHGEDASHAEHASGFIPPTPRMHRGDSEAFVNDIKALEDDETTYTRSHSPAPTSREETKADGSEVMADLKEAVLGGDIEATMETRDTKRPVEIETEDGAAHASGYVPPVPGKGEDSVETPSDVLKELRERYREYIDQKPFYRPLLTFTLSTRPLALSLARLARGLARGEPYHSALSLEDRKSKLSYSTRSRCLRINRAEELAVSLAQALAGARGGLVGIRFSPDEAGRGVGGEGLDAPISLDKRVIQIGVGKWYSRADEVKEDFATLADEEVGDRKAFEIFDLDDRGHRFKDGKEVEWPAPVHETENLPALAEISRIKKFLYSTKEEDSHYAVIYPEDILKDESAEADPEGEKIRIVHKDELSDSMVKAGEKKATGVFARRFLKDRVEQLNEHNADELAHRKAMRHTSVEYPQSAS